ncbi:cytidine deaminase [Nocardia jinanensis]|uniref:Cytidine deaminase Cdd n=1 Tax=Nocardia jinanensis TaxID=382504 RepID=A0A917VWR4_9NOCA|nr:cytidine deaminase [Nocardia jinanensis]GGL24576.1 putative cytidine deaminase Cdd [Nocardia jinanensis]
MDIDWNLLRTSAHIAMRRAYAPYSGFPVGAAGWDGSAVSVGCNVENVSYGLGLCAECVLVGNNRAAGGGRLIAVSVCDSRGEVLLPCGRCRQVLYEFGGKELLVDHRDGPVQLGRLLADAFGPGDLAAGRS